MGGDFKLSIGSAPNLTLVMLKTGWLVLKIDNVDENRTLVKFLGSRDLIIPSDTPSKVIMNTGEYKSVIIKRLNRTFMSRLPNLSLVNLYTSVLRKKHKYADLNKGSRFPKAEKDKVISHMIKSLDGVYPVYANYLTVPNDEMIESKAKDIVTLISRLSEKSVRLDEDDFDGLFAEFSALYLLDTLSRSNLIAS